MSGIPWDQPGADPLGDLNEWLRIGRERLPGGSLYKPPGLGDVLGALTTPLRAGAVIQTHGASFVLAEDVEAGDMLIVAPDGRLMRARS